MNWEGYSRVHIYPKPRNIREASRFLAMSLLISNGIRKNTVSVTRLDGKWIIASGDKLRHLRPDADTSEGWVRAVLKGKKLGAILLDNIQVPGEAALIVHRVGAGGESLRRDGLAGERIFCYLEGEDEAVECPVRARSVYSVPAWGVWRSAVLVNIILDRIESGLGPC
ncbi:MAG: hypothetical protein F7C38_06200 [Desulfurococcales archaeon]|nr:hypothetical protein [Desulfurococcales archaeon]